MTRGAGRMLPGQARHAWPRLAVLMRSLVDRYALGSLVTISVVLLVLGKADIKLVGYLGERAGDAAELVLGGLREPVRVARDLADELGRVLALKEENARLREENRRLLRWQSEAVRLQVQNQALREVLRMPVVERAPLWTTARVVADSAGPFVQTRLIDAGAERGVRKGMAVATERGMVGHVIEVGERSARVLLITDFNSRVPVVVERSRDQAILEGTNTGQPQLRFLPLNPSFAVGDRVLTSGRGGVLPPGLLVGEITRITDKGVFVTPYVDWDRLDFAAVLHYDPLPTPDGRVPTDEGRPTAAAVRETRVASP